MYAGKGIYAIALLATTTISPTISLAASVGYVQTNLTSDIPGLAPVTDSLLKNPWGMSFGLNTPFWISNQGSTTSTLFNANGTRANTLVVTTPPVPGGGPTGQVFAGGAGFNLNTGGTASFIFATLSGTIDGWNAGTTAAIQFSATDGAVYTGLGRVGSTLYAADSVNGKIDVFDNNFQKTTTSGSFVDPLVPSNFRPYNIENVGGKLYVEYFMRFQPGGYVGVFDSNGNFLQHISDPHLNSPWGVTLAPESFGEFGGDLLVGNFGDGTINAFDPVSGLYQGTLSDQNGNPIVNSGLWALEFRDPASTFNSNTLFFTAGINNEQNGLFGAIQPVPEPATLAYASLAFALGAYSCLRRKTR